MGSLCPSKACVDRRLNMKGARIFVFCLQLVFYVEMYRRTTAVFCEQEEGVEIWCFNPRRRLHRRETIVVRFLQKKQPIAWATI